MTIKSGHKHVSNTGQCFHPYLHKWNINKSNLTQLVLAMSEVFGDDPPVYQKQQVSKQQQQPQQQQQINNNGFNFYQQGNSNLGGGGGGGGFNTQQTNTTTNTNTNTNGFNFYQQKQFYGQKGNNGTGFNNNVTGVQYNNNNNNTNGLSPNGNNGTTTTNLTNQNYYNMNRQTTTPNNNTTTNNGNANFVAYRGGGNTTDSNGTIGNQGKPAFEDPEEVLRRNSTKELKFRVESALMEFNRTQTGLLDACFESQAQLSAELDKVENTITRLESKRTEIQELADDLDQQKDQLQSWLTEHKDDVANLDIDLASEDNHIWVRQYMKLDAQQKAYEEAMYYISKRYHQGDMDTKTFMSTIRKLAQKQFNAVALSNKAKAKLQEMYCYRFNALI
eukprot:TRINITY_DN270_c0_g1_i17.p1 TRINITY_DN270_c0_g1~~TRINITY_DN270_c0_g1_i17.p1  ORF type:complete len:390 (+),score=142.38 TRINITY_DN270_c0_g1_i17:587-1756(+)